MVNYYVSIDDAENKEIFEENMRSLVQSIGGSVIEVIGEERESVENYRRYYEGKFRDVVESHLDVNYVWRHWEDLGYDDKVQFTNIVDMYSEDTDYISPEIGYWVYENELINFLEVCTSTVEC